MTTLSSNNQQILVFYAEIFLNLEKFGTQALQDHYINFMCKMIISIE
jgi:hypothetical protein